MVWLVAENRPTTRVGVEVGVGVLLEFWMMARGVMPGAYDAWTLLARWQRWSACWATHGNRRCAVLPASGNQSMAIPGGPGLYRLHLIIKPCWPACQWQSGK